MLSIFNNFITEFNFSVALFQKNIPLVGGFIVLLFLIQVVNFLSGYRLIIFGIYPRKLWSLPGILFYAFLHGHFNHLFFNAIPLFLLANFVLFAGLPTFYTVTLIIILISGLLIWLFGRRGFHIGASGLIMGYWSYLITLAYYHESLLTIAPAIVCIYYFGGFIFQLFPGEVSSSWEAHVFGFLAGILAFFLNPLVLPYTEIFLMKYPIFLLAGF
jgi:membrane associated rhomboid family serine protease